MADDERDGAAPAKGADDDDPDAEACSICFDPVSARGKAAFRGHCGHALHCDCLLREFGYRKNWRCVRCTQPWQEGRFVFLTCDRESVHFGADKSARLPREWHGQAAHEPAPGAARAALRRVCSVTMLLEAAANSAHIKSFYRASPTSTGSLTVWDIFLDEWNPHTLEHALVNVTEAPFFQFQHGVLLAVALLFAAGVTADGVVACLTVADALFSKLHAFSSYKVNSRVYVALYGVIMLVVAVEAHAAAGAKQAVLGGAVVLLATMGMLQMVVSQDEAGVAPGRRLKCLRIAHLCAIKLLRVALRFAVVFGDRPRRGVAVACLCLAFTSPELGNAAWVAATWAWFKMRAACNFMFS